MWQKTEIKFEVVRWPENSQTLTYMLAEIDETCGKICDFLEICGKTISKMAQSPYLWLIILLV